MATQSHPKPIFSGRYRHALDGKNRITIPARWRRTDTDEFFLVPDETNSYLLVMPPEEFQKVNDTVSNHAEISPRERRAFIRHFYSQAQQCFADKQGRLLLPEDHCKQVGLKDEVVIVGSLARFEIWNRKKWNDSFETGKPTYKKVADLVGL